MPFEHYEAEFNQLCQKMFEDRISAIIALSKFRMRADADGYRGKFKAKVAGNWIKKVA